RTPSALKEVTPLPMRWSTDPRARVLRLYASRRYRLVGLDIVVLDDLEPAFLLALLIGGEFLGRVAQDFHVELLDELLRHVGGAHRLGDLGVHLVDDRTRHAGRAIDAPPSVGREALHALFQQRRRVGQCGGALVAGDADRPDLLGDQVRAERGQALDRHVGDTGQDVLIDRSAALVRDQVQVDVVLL